MRGSERIASIPVDRLLRRVRFCGFCERGLFHFMIGKRCTDDSSRNVTQKDDGGKCCGGFRLVIADQESRIFLFGKLSWGVSSS